MHYWRLGLLLILLSPAVLAVQPLDLTFAVPIVGVIAIAFLAMASMISTAMSDPKLQTWVKMEIRELIAGILLVAIITAFFISTPGISVALTGETNYVTVSQTILDKWLGHFDDAFKQIFVAATRIRVAATYAPYINIPLWYVSVNYSTNPLAGVGVMLMPLNMAAQALTNAIFLSEGLRMLVAFLKVVTPPILLPLAFCLRLIPFTRRLGNTMISISLAGMVFLPFGIILADSLNKTLTGYDKIGVDESILWYQMDYDKFDANPWAMVAFEWACEVIPVRALLSLTDVIFALVVCLVLLLTPWTAALYPACYNLVKEVVYPIINVVFQLTGAILLILWESLFGSPALSWLYAEGVWGEVYEFLKTVNNLVLLTYLDFILIAIITIAGARSLSAALGGEWYMAGIQRLI